MTAQVPDRIIIDGEDLPVLCNPLGQYFQATGKPSPFRGTSTALWRGYVASWLIEDDRLWLTEISNPFPAELGIGEPNIGLEQVFPDRRPPIDASWVTGTLRIGRGDIIDYIHMGYGSVFAQEEYVEVQGGRVVSRRLMEGFEVLRLREEDRARSSLRLARRTAPTLVVSGALLAISIVGPLGSWFRWIGAAGLLISLFVSWWAIQGYRESLSAGQHYAQRSHPSGRVPK